ncbi:unnamed protein product [Owenia fusiformis]|uniref:Uncharacterized protein n=1 Tax=Owenia fusiformis TaxID=6347 RepID=A0A8J1TMK4_OWEFU|nr:unnamed protein product [Owenia fusiformis]
MKNLCDFTSELPTMTMKRKDFQKAASFIHEFLLKLSEDIECAELRDSLNLALLHMQKYYRSLRLRSADRDQNMNLSASLRGLSPMTPFRDAPSKFQWRWMSLESQKIATGSLPIDGGKNLMTLPLIIQAAKEGDDELIIQLVEKDGDSLFEVDALGRTALMYAAHYNQKDTLEILLEHNIDVNAEANDGSTAAHRACHDGHTDILKLLLDYSADVLLQDTQGRAPIHWACYTQKTDCLRLLIERGANVNQRDCEGLTPCMWACRLDHIEHFELLSCVENQDINEIDGIERDNNGRTWMHWAVRRTEPLECLKTLLTPETSRIKDNDGKTVMLHAAEQGSLPACKAVLEIAGKDCLRDKDDNNRTPLHLAAMSGHGELINFLLEEGTDLNSSDSFGATATDYARGRQLHYSLLILQSHQRQREKTCESPSHSNNQIYNGGNGDGLHQSNHQHPQVVMYQGNKPRNPSRQLDAPVTPRGGGRPPMAHTQGKFTPQDEGRDAISAGHKRSHSQPQISQEKHVSKPITTEAFVTTNQSNHDNGTKPNKDDCDIDKDENRSCDEDHIANQEEDEGAEWPGKQVPEEKQQNILNKGTEIELPEDFDENEHSISIGAMDVSDVEEPANHNKAQPVNQTHKLHPPSPRSQNMQSQKPMQAHYISTEENYQEEEQLMEQPNNHGEEEPMQEHPNDEQQSFNAQSQALSSPSNTSLMSTANPLAASRPFPPAILAPLSPVSSQQVANSKPHKKKKKKKKQRESLEDPGMIPPPRGYTAPVQPPNMGVSPIMGGTGFRPSLMGMSQGGMFSPTAPLAPPPMGQPHPSAPLASPPMGSPHPPSPPTSRIPLSPWGPGGGGNRSQGHRPTLFNQAGPRGMRAPSPPQGAPYPPQGQPAMRPPTVDTQGPSFTYGGNNRGDYNDSQDFDTDDPPRPSAPQPPYGGNISRPPTLGSSSGVGQGGMARHKSEENLCLSPKEGEEVDSAMNQSEELTSLGLHKGGLRRSPSPGGRSTPSPRGRLPSPIPGGSHHGGVSPTPKTPSPRDSNRPNNNNEQGRMVNSQSKPGMTGLKRPQAQKNNSGVVTPIAANRKQSNMRQSTPPPIHQR